MSAGAGRWRRAAVSALLALAAALALSAVFSLYLRPGFIVGYANLVFVCQ